MSATKQAVVAAMVAYWDALPDTRLDAAIFAENPDANRFVKENLFAFLMAAALDRGGKAFRLWNIPFKLREKWGHLDSSAIMHMDHEELARDPIIASAPSLTSRRDLAKTIITLARVIEQDHHGRPAGLLEGSIEDALAKLQRVHGIGPGIARMIVIQRLLFFDLQPLASEGLLPKIDVHIKRVFERTGLVTLANDETVRAALVELSARHIAILDQVAWKVGQTFCTPLHPRCADCCLSSVCQRVGIAC